MGWILMWGPAAGEPGCILSFMVKVVSVAVCILFLAGCSPNNTESLQRHTADATAAAKRSAGAIARGVAEGLVRKGPLDINAASAAELQRLPGVSTGGGREDRRTQAVCLDARSGAQRACCRVRSSTG